MEKGEQLVSLLLQLLGEFSVAGDGQDQSIPLTLPSRADVPLDPATACAKMEAAVLSLAQRNSAAQSHFLSLLRESQNTAAKQCVANVSLSHVGLAVYYSLCSTGRINWVG